MADYSFMKSGFDNLVHEDPTENIASIVLVFMENAVITADKYVKHANRKTITAEDIKSSQSAPGEVSDEDLEEAAGGVIGLLATNHRCRGMFCNICFD